MSTLQEDMDELKAALSELGRSIHAAFEPLLCWLLRVTGRS